ncbi:MAG: bifunctional glutamate N-acetyltransferase/amino-acid acetyltransferase ArgJ [Proteobacteria bacterium]|nr:bifunctional glutamate N-acetyltransferase/amino-acid acetyltransferase ArgJ [Pseudomonadota bacterium]
MSKVIAVSPLAPSGFPDLPAIPGVRLAAGACGLRYKGRVDLLLCALDPQTTVAGVFTRSLTASAPVEWCRAALTGGKARVLVVNSGNSNAFTGKLGRDAVRRTADAAAAVIGCKPKDVFIASTGVIGEPLADEKIRAALPGLDERASPDAWAEAAAAIMTTDTFAKAATRTVTIGGAPVTINGIAKGSGMIAPDMATMLAFVFTDAKIPTPVLQALLTQGNERSFNCTTVDGDTSTSDTLLAFATGQAKHPKVTRAAEPHLRGFRKAFDAVLLDLAQQVVRDGEGATKFVTIGVEGAASARAAKRIALAIANSPLVKTAIAGEDANWGRIVMAVGKAGEKADRDRLAISIGGVLVAQNGGRVPDYDEAPVARHMKGSEIDIRVEVGVGRGRAQVWTCDLTHGYISINGDYRS